MGKFVIASISNQVQNNHLAWCKTIEYASSLEEAQLKAKKVWANMCNEFDDLVSRFPDSEFIMSESVIIHDGENIY